MSLTILVLIDSGSLSDGHMLDGWATTKSGGSRISQMGQNFLQKTAWKWKKLDRGWAGPQSPIRSANDKVDKTIYDIARLDNKNGSRKRWPMEEQYGRTCLPRHLLQLRRLRQPLQNLHEWHHTILQWRLRRRLVWLHCGNMWFFFKMSIADKGTLLIYSKHWL